MKNGTNEVMEGLLKQGHSADNVNNFFYGRRSAGSTSMVNAAALKLEAGGNPINPAEKEKATHIPEELFMTWDELSKKDLLAGIKKRDITLWGVLYNKEYGKYPPGFHDNANFDLKLLYEAELIQFTTKQLVKMSWDELMEKSLTNELKMLDNESYRLKYFSTFGKYPTLE